MMRDPREAIVARLGLLQPTVPDTTTDTRDGLIRALLYVTDVHRADSPIPNSSCVCDGEDWPCGTVRGIAANLGLPEGQTVHRSERA